MNQLQTDIKNNSYNRFYLLYGEESYTIISLRNKLKKALEMEEDDINYAYYTGKNMDIHDCIDRAIMAPFFGEKKLIVIEDTEFFKSSNDMSSYLDDIPESTILLFIENKKDADPKKSPIDKRNKLYKYINKNGVVIECSKPNERDVFSFLKIKLRDSGKIMSESTARYFLGQIDNSLFNVQNELEKLVNYTGDRQEILKEDVDKLTSGQLVNRMFMMIDEIAAGNASRVMEMYKELVELRINVNVILANLRTHFKHLLELKLSRDVPKKEFIAKTKMQFFLYDRYLAQIRNFSVEDLKHKLELCIEMEYDFKTGRVSDEIGLEMLIIELLR
ncbi:MAG: DNA polymerase III subunit delta [Lachnospiraceae bacterium]|nr:DNA polymerase III subunit delta [Lachnospiraceae bacterium]